MSPDDPSGIQSASLDLLHQQIDGCFVCAKVVPGLIKPTTMRRGELGPIMIVGQNPGNKEINTNEAFSGQSGKRLNQWLCECGASTAHPRKGIYLTSIAKCAAPPNYLPTLVRNCRPFINRQISIIRPRLVITLGIEAYEELAFIDLPFSEAVCKEFHSQEHALTTAVGFHYSLVPWPHPSGLSRWHNEPSNQELLKASFRLVESYLKLI